MASGASYRAAAWRRVIPLSCEHEDTAPATFRNMVGLERTAERKVSQSLRTKSWRMSPIDWNMVCCCCCVLIYYVMILLCSLGLVQYTATIFGCIKPRSRVLLLCFGPESFISLLEEGQALFHSFFAFCSLLLW